MTSYFVTIDTGVAIHSGPGFNRTWLMNVHWSELCELLRIWVKTSVFDDSPAVGCKAQSSDERHLAELLALHLLVLCKMLYPT